MTYQRRDTSAESGQASSSTRRTCLIVLLTAILFGPGKAWAGPDEEFIKGLRTLGLLDLAGDAAAEALASPSLTQDDRIGIQFESLLVARDLTLQEFEAARLEQMLARLDAFSRDNASNGRAALAALEAVPLRWSLARLLAGGDAESAAKARRIISRALEDAKALSADFSRSLEIKRREYRKLENQINRLRNLGEKYGREVLRLRELRFELRSHLSATAKAEFLEAGTQMELARMAPASSREQKENLLEAADAFEAFYRKYRREVAEAFEARAREIECILMLGEYNDARKLADDTYQELLGARSRYNPAVDKALREARVHLCSLLARVENDTANYDAALRVAADGVKVLGDEPGIALERNIALLKLGKDPKGSMAVMAETAGGSGEYAGRALDTLSDLDAAAIRSLSPTVRLRIALRLWARGRYAKVASTLAPPLPPGDSETLIALTLLAESQVHNGEQTRGIESLTAIAQKFPNTPEGAAALRRAVTIQIGLASGEAADGPQWGRAAQMIDTYAKRYPNDQWVSLALGDVECGRGRLSEAIREYRKIDKEAPLYGTALVRIAEAWWTGYLLSDRTKRGPVDEAVAASVEAISWCRSHVADPAFSGRKGDLARTIVSADVVRCVALCDGLERFETVISEYGDFKKMHPDEGGVDAVERCVIVSMLEKGNLEEARARLETFRSEYPKSPNVATVLLALRDAFTSASDRARTAEDPARARRMHEDAIWAGTEYIETAGDPRPGDYLLVAGWLREDGRFDRVIELLTRASAKFSEPSVQEKVTFELAGAHASGGTTEGLDRAIELLRQMMKKFGNKPYIGEGLALNLLAREKMSRGTGGTDQDVLREAVALINAALPEHEAFSPRWCLLNWELVRSAADMVPDSRVLALVRNLAFITNQFSKGSWSTGQKDFFNQVLKGKVQ